MTPVAVGLCVLTAAFIGARSQLYDDDYGRDVQCNSEYQILWNMPTFQCRKHVVNFTTDQWCIRQNYGDEFRGDSVALLYDPGLFPALLATTAGAAPVPRNGGVPQAGNLSVHLDRFRRDLDKLIPATSFHGVGIIDFEHWRPVWKQNWLSLSVYKDYSMHLVRKMHPWWSNQDIEKEAIERFQSAAKMFMLETLRLAKAMRPRALWGYYGYPLCFNYKPVGNKLPCTEETKRQNDGLKWLFKESSALFPSVYLGSTETRNREFIVGRVEEAIRMSKASLKKSQVYVYVWPKYRDANRFLSKEDLESSMMVPREEGAEGSLIWGSSNDLNNRDKCLAVQDYLQTYLGPIALRIINAQYSSLFNNFLEIFGKK